MKLVALRAAIVSFGETELNATEKALYLEAIERYDVIRVKQQGMEDILFGMFDGPGRIGPLQPLIYGNRPGHEHRNCRLGRYDPQYLPEFNRLANANTSPNYGQSRILTRPLLALLV